MLIGCIVLPLVLLAGVAWTAGMSDAEIASQAPRLRALLSEMTSSIGERNSIWIIDRNGHVLVTDFKSADAGTSVANRDYFQAQVAPDPRAPKPRVAQRARTVPSESRAVDRVACALGGGAARC
jgi:hypothetical protein